MDMPSENRIQRNSNQRLFVVIVAVVLVYFINSTYIEKGWNLSDLEGQICIAASALLLTIYWWLPSNLFPKSYTEAIVFDQQGLQIFRGAKVWKGCFSDWHAFKVDTVAS